MSETSTAIEPTPGRQSLIYTEMLKKLEDLALARQARLVAADNIRLAPVFWETIVFLFLILLVLALFSAGSFSLGGAMALACQGSAVTLLVALVFVFDRPFKSKTFPFTKNYPVGELAHCRRCGLDLITSLTAGC